jgi:hypothetical protein
LLAGRAQCLGDVEAEWSVAATVGAKLAAIDPDGRFPIHGAEMEQHAVLAAAIDCPIARRGEGPAIPYPFVDLFAQADAGERCLVGERDEDAARERSAGGPAIRTALVLIIEGELPQAIQV